jgi:hypothetical protein
MYAGSKTDKEKMLFKTERLPLATYLQASGCLKFLRCEPARPGRVAFIFEDEHGEGPQLQMEFDMGAAVSAIALFAAQTFLRRAINNPRNTNPQNKEITFERSNTR